MIYRQRNALENTQSSASRMRSSSCGASARASRSRGHYLWTVTARRDWQTRGSSRSSRAWTRAVLAFGRCRRRRGTWRLSSLTARCGRRARGFYSLACCRFPHAWGGLRSSSSGESRRRSSFVSRRLTGFGRFMLISARRAALKSCARFRHGG